MHGLKNVQRRWGDTLAESRWDEVERLLAEHYRAQGFDVDHVGTGNSRNRFDGGIDLKLRKDGRYTVVQCKHWNAKQVPHNAVHELIGVMATEGAQSAVLVTSGEFTRHARDSAAKVGTIELVDGAQLREWLGPVLPRAATQGESSVEAFTGSVLDAVADRLVRPNTRRSRAAEAGLGLVVAKAVATLLFLIFFVLVVPKMLGAIITSTLPRPPISAPSAPPTPLSPFRQTNSQSPAVLPVTSDGLTPFQPVLPRSSAPAPVAQFGPAESMMSPEELREWKRKNEESMRVLEKRVPELRH